MKSRIERIRKIGKACADEAIEQGAEYASEPLIGDFDYLEEKMDDLTEDEFCHFSEAYRMHLKEVLG